MMLQADQQFFDRDEHGELLYDPDDPWEQSQLSLAHIHRGTGESGSDEDE